MTDIQDMRLLKKEEETWQSRHTHCHLIERNTTQYCSHANETILALRFSY